MERKLVVEHRNGNKWEVSRTVTDEHEVYMLLVHDLASIVCFHDESTKVRRKNNHDGTQTFVFTDKFTRATYTVTNIFEID